MPEQQKTDAEWEKFRHLFQRETIPAKTILLKEGEVSEKMFYIEKGCIRLSFNKDGKDITFQFFFEGEGVASAESFRNTEPSLFTIESIEPCVIHTLLKKDYFTMINTSPVIKQLLEEQTFQRLMYYQKLFLSRIKNSPEEIQGASGTKSPHFEKSAAALHRFIFRNHVGFFKQNP